LLYQYQIRSKDWIFGVRLKNLSADASWCSLLFAHSDNHEPDAEKNEWDYILSRTLFQVFSMFFSHLATFLSVFFIRRMEEEKVYVFWFCLSLFFKAS